MGHGTPTARGSHLRYLPHPFAHIGVRDRHLSAKFIINGQKDFY